MYKLEREWGEWVLKENDETVDLKKKENLSIIAYMMNGYNNLKKEILELKTALYYSVKVEDYRKECERLVIHTNEVVNRAIKDMIAFEGSSPSILKTADKIRENYIIKSEVN
jgi:hypothetical protein